MLTWLKAGALRANVSLLFSVSFQVIDEFQVNHLSKVVTSGTCALSNAGIVLAANENQLITFAVRMPVEPATYRLAIEFDNRDV